MFPPVTANYTAVCVQDLHTQKTCLCSELSKNYNRSIIPSKSVESTKSCRVSRVAACTRAQSLNAPCPCATYIWLLHPAPTSAQDGLDPLQLVLVVFFLPSISAKTSLALEVGIICNLRWWCFSCVNYIAHCLRCTHDLNSSCCYPLQLALVMFFSTKQAFTNVHTYKWALFLQLALCGGGGGVGAF